MPIQFDFIANRIYFGSGMLQRVVPLVAAVGRRILVVTGRPIQDISPLLEQFKIRRMEYSLFGIQQEPTLSMISRCLQQAREFSPEVIVGIGGGSAIDAGKAAAILYTNSGPILDYLELCGAGKPLTNKPLPYIAVPTTAGTGSEVTKNAVLIVEDTQIKVSLRHEMMLPLAAVIDPLLSHSLPPAATAATGLDAITQLIEPMVSRKANPFTDALCRQALKMATRSLIKAVEHGADAAAREEMCFAAVCGGLALANAGLGAVHGFAGVIGGMFPAPHGQICARLLPQVIRVNVQALRRRAPNSTSLSQYKLLAKLILDSADASTEQLVDYFECLNERLAIPSLAAFGVTPSHHPSIIRQAQKASSMKNNPIELNEEELNEIMDNA
ncbi:MAG: iron-containing alcohol dehydrogenase [Calditrichaeota bacterium]|nr:MAG: iron-containing alcohol dehydrogenase [Calditrichota bacterium]